MIRRPHRKQPPTPPSPTLPRHAFSQPCAGKPAHRLPGTWLLAAAAGRLRPTHPDWARAMLAEAEACPSEAARLRWAWGCWVASLRTRTSVNTLLYTALLAAGLALLAAYEWHADESRRTVIVLSLISLALGALHPRHAIVSGALTGLVVAAIIGFEAITGIRPAYEVRAQTLQHSLFWLILLVPALSSAAVGGKIGRVLRPARQSP